MLKRLLAVFSLLMGAMLHAQSTPDGPYAVMDPDLAKALFSGLGSSVTLTSLDGTLNLPLTYTNPLGPVASNNPIEVGFCPGQPRASVVSLAVIAYNPINLPSQCPLLWLAADTKGNVKLVAQGSRAAFAPALLDWLPDPPVNPSAITLGYFLEATNLLSRTVSADLTDALFTAANATGKISIPVTLQALKGSAAASGDLVRTSQGAPGLLIIQGSTDIAAGNYLIASSAQALSASPLDPTKVFPVAVSGAAGASTTAPVTIDFVSTLPFTQPTGPVSYPDNTTFSWRLPSGTAGSAAVTGGTKAMTPDPTSEGMLAMWKTLPFSATNQSASADVRIPNITATLSSQLSATYSAGNLDITLQEPTQIPIPGPSNTLLAGATVVTAPPNPQLVTNSLAVAGFLTLSFNDWQKALQQSQQYLVFSTGSTAGAVGLQLTPQTATEPFGQLTTKNDLTVTLQAPQGSQGLQGAVTVNNASQEVTLQILSGGTQATMTLADWNKVSQPGGGWTAKDASGANYQLVFQTYPAAAFTTNGGTIGSFTVAKSTGYDVIWDQGTISFLQKNFPKQGATLAAVGQNFPASSWNAQLLYSNDSYKLQVNSGTGLVPQSEVEIVYAVNPSSTNWIFQVTAIDSTKMTITLGLNSAAVFVQGSGFPTQVVTDIITPFSGAAGTYSFNDTKITGGWLRIGLNDWATAWQTLYANWPTSTPSAMINFDGVPFQVSRSSEFLGFGMSYGGLTYVTIPFGGGFDPQWNVVGVTIDYSGKQVTGRISEDKKGVYITSSDYQNIVWPWTTNAGAVDVTLQNNSTMQSFPAQVLQPNPQAGLPWGSIGPATAPVQINPCMDVLEAFGTGGASEWICTNDQAAITAAVGTRCYMYECQYPIGNSPPDTILFGDSGCTMPAGNSSQARTNGQTQLCYVVPCTQYGQWMGVGGGPTPVDLPNNAGSWCLQVSTPALNYSPYSCVWCPGASTVQNFGGVVPYIPSVHGFFPKVNGGKGFPQTGYPIPQPPSLQRKTP